MAIRPINRARRRAALLLGASLLLAPLSARAQPAAEHAATGCARSGARLPWQQPFSCTSPWNIGIGANARWGRPGDPDVAQLRSLGGKVNIEDWSLPIFVGDAHDPFVVVVNTDRGSPVPPQWIHIPRNAKPAGGTDRNISFFDKTQPTKVWSYWNIQFRNGKDVTGGLTAGLGAVYDTRGNGFSAPWYSPHQLDYNYAGGVINGYDLARGEIAHMLHVATSADATRMPPGSNYFTRNIPWPNSHVDYDGPRLYKGKIIAGSTFGIPSDVNLDTLGLSPGGMMLARALQRYGAIWKDIAGTHQFTFFSMPSLRNNKLLQEMDADVPKIIPHLSILRNQGPQSVNGGGRSIASPPLPLVIPSAAPAAAGR